jgi:hypothetical protein
MSLWRKRIVPGLAALAAVLLIAAGAAGVDQMANIRISSPALVTIPTVTAGGQPPLRHLILRGLAEGSLPGGLPYDEAPEEEYDENYQETLYLPTTPA